MAEQELPYIIWDIIKELSILFVFGIALGIAFFSILLPILLMFAFYPQLYIIAFFVFLYLNCKKCTNEELRRMYEKFTINYE
jgi:hypothetical protein